MDEKADRRLRRRALRLLAVGVKPGAVRTRVGRSQGWWSQWRIHVGTKGSVGLRSQSRRPRPSPQAWARALGRLSVQTRLRLRRAPRGLIGARAMRPELRARLPRRRLPWGSTR